MLQVHKLLSVFGGRRLQGTNSHAVLSLGRQPSMTTPQVSEKIGFCVYAVCCIHFIEFLMHLCLSTTRNPNVRIDRGDKKRRNFTLRPPRPPEDMGSHRTPAFRSFLSWELLLAFGCGQ